ncbi:MAG: ABC-ATPase domain-containing protein [Eubacteriales bacterium]|nr:ABC-ATPase domain-containing protein [Eubacteriales bacterium]
MINNLSSEYVNLNKNTREKAQFSAQAVTDIFIRRSGIFYNTANKRIVLKLNFNIPLVNALSVNAKSAVRSVKDILEHIETAVSKSNMMFLTEYISLNRRQREIRTYMKAHRLIVFIADGSILPRENGTDQPMKNAIPFISPKSMRITIPFTDGGEITGMVIKQGVTVITGGGYSGKSTLLDAIETGIFDHIPGDGREYVMSDNSLLKIYAEDGRPVHELNLTPFFRNLPCGVDTESFSTLHASGSVSQAANIIEAVCGGSKLLLIDEDKSATNFMIRDRNMRKIVKNEPIIPFTDRVRELYLTKSVSTILVIGGSSEYLKCADIVILMEDYTAKDITNDVRRLELLLSPMEEPPANWTVCRRILTTETTQPFLFFRSVETENEKKIILDDYSADITLLTALKSGAQMNTLACMMEQLLCDKDAVNEELILKLSEIFDKMFDKDGIQLNSLLPETATRWYEEIRPIDAFCCVNRMRGVNFKKSNKGDTQRKSIKILL